MNQMISGPAKLSHPAVTMAAMIADRWAKMLAVFSSPVAGRWREVGP
jgi:hypothetical protein